MEFSQDNKVVQLCVEGMELEGQGQLAAARSLFGKAWAMAETDVEKFTAAHYVARHQDNISDKLRWDETALHHALKTADETVKEALPSLYLNIGKGYEDLNDFEPAKKHYEAALSFAQFLPDDEYGNTIKRGISNGLERVK